MITDEDELNEAVSEAVEMWDEARRVYGKDTPVEELCRNRPHIVNAVACRIRFFKALDRLFTNEDTDEDFENE